MSGNEGDEAGDTPLIFFLVAIFTGVVFQTLIGLKPWWIRWSPPYSVLLFLIGMILSRFSSNLGSLGPSIDEAKGTHPHILLFYLLPPLLYESASQVDFHMFARVSKQSFFLAVPSVMAAIGVIGMLLKLAFVRYAFTWAESFLAASILCATDPVAVVNALTSLGAPKKLAYLIEGESLLNDGSAFVFFLIFQEIAAGGTFSLSGAVLQFMQLAVGGPAWGYLCAVVLEFFLGWMRGSGVHEVSSLVVGVYATFYLAEAHLHVSGVLAVVSLGLYMSLSGKYALSPDVEHFAHAVVMQVSFLANTILFVLAGVLVEDKIISARTDFIIFVDYLYLLLLFAALHISRVVQIASLRILPGKERYGYKESVILVYGGLRGAVGLALGLIVELDPLIRPDVRTRINFLVAGIVTMTITLNGTTIEALYKWLEVYKPNPFRPQELAEAVSLLPSVRQIERAVLGKELEEELSPYAAAGMFVPDRKRAQKVKRAARVESTGLYNIFNKVRWDLVDAIVPKLSQAVFRANPIQYKYEETISRVFSRADKRTDPLPPALSTRYMTGTRHWQTVEAFIEDLRLDAHTRDCLLGSSKKGHKGVKFEQLLSLKEADLLHMGVTKIGPRKKILRKIEKMRQGEGVTRVNVYESFFNAVHAHYHHQHEQDAFSGKAMVMLVNATDHGQDHKSDELVATVDEACSYEDLCPVAKEWEHLKKAIRLPNAYERAESIPIIGYAASYMAYFHHRAAIEALAGYIEAHEKAIRELGEPFFSRVVYNKIIEAEKLLHEKCQERPAMSLVVLTLYGVRFVIHIQLRELAKLYKSGKVQNTDYHQLAQILQRRLNDLNSFYKLSHDKWEHEFDGEFVTPRLVDKPSPSRVPSSNTRHLQRSTSATSAEYDATGSFSGYSR